MVEYAVTLVARVPAEIGPPTFAELGPLMPSSFSYDGCLNGSGMFEGTSNVRALNDDIKQRLRDPLHYPSEVWIWRNDALVWAGPVLGIRVADGQATITARCLLAYIEYMVVPNDRTFADVEQFEIIARLIDDWQNLDYGNFGLDVSEYLPPGATTSGVVRSLGVLGIEKHSVGEIINTFAGINNGFDWYLEPATRKIKFAHPRKGIDLSSSVFVEQGIEASEVSLSVAPGVVVTDAYGIGTGGDVSLSSHQEALDAQASFGRVSGVVEIDGAVDQTTLNDATLSFLNSRQTALIVPGGTIKPTPEADVPSFGLGDTISWSHDPGLGRITGAYRVASKKITVSQGGAERMEIQFE